MTCETDLCVPDGPTRKREPAGITGCRWDTRVSVPLAANKPRRLAVET